MRGFQLASLRGAKHPTPPTLPARRSAGHQSAGKHKATSGVGFFARSRLSSSTRILHAFTRHDFEAIPGVPAGSAFLRFPCFTRINAIGKSIRFMCWFCCASFGVCKCHDCDAMLLGLSVAGGSVMPPQNAPDWSRLGGIAWYLARKQKTRKANAYAGF